MTRRASLTLCTLAVAFFLGGQSAFPQNDPRVNEPAEAFVVTPSDGRAFSVGRAVVESGLGDFSVFETTLPPAESPATPLHRHDVYDEGFLVLDGVVDFVAGGKTSRCGAGCFAFIPRGIEHGFSNRGTGVARMWVIGSSGVQAMVEEVAPLLSENPPRIEEAIEIFARHKSELIGVPPASSDPPANAQPR